MYSCSLAYKLCKVPRNCLMVASGHFSSKTNSIQTLVEGKGQRFINGLIDSNRYSIVLKVMTLALLH